MLDTFEFETDELDETERDYLEDVLASDNPDEIEEMLRYFGRDCY